ncbi:semaphorin-6A-like [Sceloporus undulatus]|uniref:semaphorin-6A-like n=1 Tax=Sceloporus undulatus TaxID=8520 RepID=UPI001C4D4EDF|nr:semaphorin-6A-like [Sceloporus undulatus]
MRTEFILLCITLLHFGASFPYDALPISMVDAAYSHSYPAFMGYGADDSSTTALKMDIQLLMLSDATLYIGARDHVYTVNLDESYTDQIYLSKKLVWEASETAQEGCRILGQLKDECHNFIKVLLKRNENLLFICGTNAFSPTCRHYKEDTLEPEGEDISGKGKCPYFQTEGNVALFADNNLYSATVTDFHGLDPIIYRSLGDNPRLRTVKQDSRWLKDPSFVHAVDYGKYIYFFFREVSVEYHGVAKVTVARVARVCKNDIGGNIRFLEKEWTSFLKARLICTVPGDPPFSFDILQDVTDVVKVQDRDMVFALFTTPKNSIPGSACCAFDIGEIEKAFIGSFKHQRTPVSIWTPVPDYEVPKPRPGSCAGSGSLEEYASSSEIPDETLEFLKTHTLMDASVDAVYHEPLFMQTVAQVTGFLIKIAVDDSAGPNEDNTVLFIGTEEGWLFKILVWPKGNDFIKDSIFIEEMYIYNLAKCSHDMKIYKKVMDLKLDKPRGALYVAFPHCVVRVPLGSCERHGSCKKSCIASRDPYCGWSNGACIYLPPGTTVEYEQDLEKGNTDGMDDC